MRRKLVLSALTLAALSAGTLFALRGPQTPPEMVGSVEEQSAITASNGLVARQGTTLSLKLRSGEILALTERGRCGDMDCPPRLTSHYRYLGWDDRLAGYRLAVNDKEMLLPFDDDPVLMELAHAEPPTAGPLPLPAAPPAATQDDSLADWLAEIAKTRSEAEAPLIRATKGNVERDGGQLKLSLSDGRHLVLTDDQVCGQLSCPPQLFRSFDYGGQPPGGRYHVVEERWDEAAASLLIETTSGAITELVGPPKFSTDGKLAVDALPDLQRNAPHRLELWDLSGERPRLIFQQDAAETDDTVFQVVGWADAEHVRLSRGPWGSDQHMPVMLSHDGNGWRLTGGEGNN